MYTDYGADINKVNMLDASPLAYLIIRELTKVEVNDKGLTSLLTIVLNECQLDPEAFKKKYLKYWNSNKDQLYFKIGEYLDTDDEGAILLMKSTICRIHEWYLLTDKELGNINVKPPVIDMQYHIYKDISDPFDILTQIENNRHSINEFLGYESKIDIQSTMDKADKIFLEMIAKEISEFRGRLQKRKSKGFIRKRTTNKSAPFYGVEIEGMNSFIENMFEYDTDLRYKVYLDDNLDRIKLPGNYDYIVSNIIKNKTKGTREVFFGSSQVNSFLKPINDDFERSFRNCDYLGVYDQDKAIADIVETIQTNLGRNLTALSLDVSKYSDTLPKSLLYHVCLLLTGDDYLSKSIIECIGLDVVWNGGRYKHNASLQGIYFDFSLITMTNLYVQICISCACNERLIQCKVVGDDAITLITGNDYKLYSKIGTEVWALFGCKVNEDKRIACNMSEGEFTFLKYRAEIVEGNIVNISGIPAGLLLKNIISYNRIGSIIAYLKKSRYIERSEIPRNFVSNYCKLFRESIKMAYIRLKVPKDDIDELYNNAFAKLMDRPFIFGGLKEYDIDDRHGRIELVEDVKKMKNYWDEVFISREDSTIDLIDEISRIGNIPNHPLKRDIAIFYAEEYKNISIKILKFLKQADHFIDTGEGDIKEIREAIKNLSDRKFDRYKPSGLTTDRTAVQHFEDKLMLSKYKEANLEPMLFIRPAKNFVEKQANSVALDILTKENPDVRFRTALKNSDNIMIELGFGRVVQLGMEYSNQSYYNADDIKHYVATNEEFRKAVITAIGNSCSDSFKDKALIWLIEDIENVKEVISSIESVAKGRERYRLSIEEVVNNAIKECIDNRLLQALKEIDFFSEKSKYRIEF